jgi:hypothetical protein
MGCLSTIQHIVLLACQFSLMVTAEYSVDSYSSDSSNFIRRLK